MPSVVERVSVLETKVDGLNEKIDDIKVDVKSNHEDIKEQLKTMYDASCTQHAELAKKISEIEKFKNKWAYMTIGGIAVIAWVAGHLQIVENFLK